MHIIPLSAKQIEEKLLKIPDHWGEVAEQSFDPESIHAQSGLAVAEALENTLQFTAQELDTAEQAQARDNISAASVSEVDALRAKMAEDLSGLSDSTAASLLNLNNTKADKTDIAEQLAGKVDTTRKINGKALNSDISLTPADIGALPSNTQIPSITGLATETYVNSELAKKSDEGHGHSIAAGASDDDVVILTGTGGTDSVTYTAAHAKPANLTTGTYKSVTVDAYGHVTGGSNPTTLDGYGISNAYTKTEVNAELAKKSDTGHTHATTIATSTNTNELTLEHGKKYAITAGGDSFVFTMPSDNNTHHTATMHVGAKDSTANATSATSNPYLVLRENSTNRSQLQVKGDGPTSVSADDGIITISTDAYTKSDADAKVSAAVSGLASTSSVNAAISNHNTSASAHNDIRETLAQVKEDVDAFFKDATISDAAKDTLKEIQEYITSDAEAAAAMAASIGEKSIKGHTHAVSHTPAGSVSQPTFTGTEAGHTHSFSVSGGGSHGHSFTGTAASHDHSFTGTSTLIKATFAGTEQTASVSYTPAGTVSKPTITVTPNTTTVNSITGVGTLPSLTYDEVKASKITSWSAGSAPSLTFTQGSLPSASLSGGSASLTGSVSTGPNRTVTLTLSHSNPTLSFSAGTLPTATFNAGSIPSLTYEEVAADNITAWSAGTLPTKGSNTTVVTSIKSATSTQPTFTGTAATISHKHTPAGTITVTTAAPGSGETANYTPAGTVGSKSLTPTGTVNANTISVSGTTGETKLTPAGTVSKPTFTGTAATLTTSAANS